VKRIVLRVIHAVRTGFHRSVHVLGVGGEDIGRLAGAADTADGAIASIAAIAAIAANGGGVIRRRVVGRRPHAVERRNDVAVTASAAGAAGTVTGAADAASGSPVGGGGVRAQCANPAGSAVTAGGAIEAVTTISSRRRAAGDSARPAGTDIRCAAAAALATVSTAVTAGAAGSSAIGDAACTLSGDGAAAASATVSAGGAVTTVAARTAGGGTAGASTIECLNAGAAPAATATAAAAAEAGSGAGTLPRRVWRPPGARSPLNSGAAESRTSARPGPTTVESASTRAAGLRRAHAVACRLR